MAAEALFEFKESLALKSQTRLADANHPREQKIVAEGDSWFDYPLVRDIVDHLRRMDYAVFKKSKHGDTMENMVYGTDYHLVQHRAVNHGSENLDDTLEAIRAYKPRFVIFSAGGNDIVGEEMAFYLNHKRTALPFIRRPAFDFVVQNVLKPSIERFLTEVWQVDGTVDILMDGYDYAQPNGTRYLGVVGPWMLPAFGKKAITDRAEQKTIVKELVDGYNDMLKDLEATHPRFHYIDLRGMFPNESQWHNEIHLRSEGYETVARKYNEKMKSILNGRQNGGNGNIVA